MKPKLQKISSRTRKILIIVATFAFVAVFTTIFILCNNSKKNKPNTTEQTENSTTSQKDVIITEQKPTSNTTNTTATNTTDEEKSAEESEKTEELEEISAENCTLAFGPLVLINSNFTVDTDYIWTRATQLVDLTDTYGILEGNPWNGAPLMDAEAAAHLADMLAAYSADFSGHTMTTRSCFRSYGTSCGRLCAATGTSEHHAGYSCDLIDDAYTDSLDTELYDEHLEWQWLKANSYRFGFIDRYPLEWAGGTMDEPLNVDATGTTGYYETWHYRYVGLPAASEIASGTYNGGAYDSLEHYLLSAGYLTDLLDQTSCAP